MRSGLALVAFIATACASGTPSGPPSSGGSTASEAPIAATSSAATATVTAGPADPSSVAAARSVIEAADVTDAATLDAIEPLRSSAEGMEAARAILGSGATGDAAWAALWIYLDGGSDPEPLRPYAGSSDPSLAVMAAAGLVALGDRAGLEAMAGLLASDAPLRGAHPPRSVAAVAASTLFRYVPAAGAPTLAGATDTTDLAAAWQDWLAANASSLTFDPDARTWSR